MENEKNRQKKEPGENRSGENRRKFSFGYQGRERRKGVGRRKDDKAPD